MMVRSWITTLLLLQFKLPKFVIYHVMCDILEGDGSVVEAIACFRQMELELARGMSFRDEQAQWVLGEWSLE